MVLVDDVVYCLVYVWVVLGGNGGVDFYLVWVWVGCGIWIIVILGYYCLVLCFDGFECVDIDILGCI